MSLTVAYITGRTRARFDWFFDSLARQKGLKRVTQIIIVDFYTSDDMGDMEAAKRTDSVGLAAKKAGIVIDLIDHVPPKPTIWQGPHRITKENWWAMSSARNTAFALCKNPWIALLDDRCVLAPDWMTGIKRAIAGNYVVFGSYEKHYGLNVRNGLVTGSEHVSGVDNRLAMAKGKLVKANGAWAYGCNLALPLEIALKVNGYPEKADGMSFEDILFGMVLHNNHYPLRYDPNMRVIQDRTPADMDKPFRREDKGVSPNDKSHASLDEIGGKKRSENEHDLRAIRNLVLNGGQFPVPDPNGDYRDWFDGQPIREL